MREKEFCMHPWAPWKKDVVWKCDVLCNSAVPFTESVQPLWRRFREQVRKRGISPLFIRPFPHWQSTAQVVYSLTEETFEIYRTYFRVLCLTFRFNHNLQAVIFQHLALTQCWIDSNPCLLCKSTSFSACQQRVSTAGIRGKRLQTLWQRFYGSTNSDGFWLINLSHWVAYLILISGI